MDKEVQKEYEKVLRRVIAKHGTVVSLNASFYGWGAWDIRHGQDPCPITVTGRAHETYWGEFMGTFYEGDTTVTGIEADGANCECGAVKDRSMRWRASVSEVAEAVFGEMLLMMNGK